MAEKETKNSPKDLVEATPEEVKKFEEETPKKVEGAPVAGEVAAPVDGEAAPVVDGETAKLMEEKKLSEKEVSGRIKRLDRRQTDAERAAAELLTWIPKTVLGIAVKAGKEKDIDDILLNRKKILEPQIIDTLLSIESDFINIGQAKGKFGGGKRRAWRQTQKKTKEGNVMAFSAMVAVGDREGHIGLGYGGSKETLPAREKAARQAKLSLVRIRRGVEDPHDSAKEDVHTIPFKVNGKCGGAKITLFPAPRGTGLVVADELKKIFLLAGIKDVYSKTNKRTRTTFNLARACVEALNKTNDFK